MNSRFASTLAFAAWAGASTLAAALTAGTARAESPTIDNTRFVSQLTRDEVRAEVLRDHQAMRGAPGEAGSNDIAWAPQQSTMTPAQARAEFIASRDAAHAMVSEDGGSQSLAQVQPSTSAPTRMAGADSR